MRPDPNHLHVFLFEKYPRPAWRPLMMRHSTLSLLTWETIQNPCRNDVRIALQLDSRGRLEG